METIFPKTRMEHATKKSKTQFCSWNAKSSWSSDRLPATIVCHIASFLDCQSHQEGFARLAKWTQDLSKRPASWSGVVYMQPHHKIDNLLARGCQNVNQLVYAPHSRDGSFHETKTTQAVQAWSKTLTMIRFDTFPDDDDKADKEVWRKILEGCSRLETLFLPALRRRLREPLSKPLETFPNLKRLEGMYDLCHIQSGTKLETLCIDFLRNSAPLVLPVFPALQKLDLYIINLSKLPQGLFTLGNFPSLTQLSLRGTEAEEIPWIANSVAYLIHQDLLDRLVSLALLFSSWNTNRLLPVWTKIPFRSKTIRDAFLPFDTFVSSALSMEKLQEDLPHVQVLCCKLKDPDGGHLLDKHVRYVSNTFDAMGMFYKFLAFHQRNNPCRAPNRIRPTLILQCDEERLPEWQIALQKHWTTGDEKNADQVYVRVDVENFVLVHSDGPGSTLPESVVDTRVVQLSQDGTMQSTPVAVLMTIFVPEAERQRGTATRIVEFVEERVNDELGRKLVVGPILDKTPAMTTLLQWRRYRPVVPFSFLQP